MKKNYYTADWHLHHKKVIEYSRRPFADVDEMNEAIIERTNERVGPEDRLYLLGDVAFANPNKALRLLDRLVCREIHLIAGNHDSPEMQKLPLWSSVSTLREINDSGHKVVLCHYPMKTWNKSHYGALHLHGHEHGSVEGNSQSLDVGVDCWDFRPVTIEECLERMAILPDYLGAGHHLRRINA